MLNLGSSKCYTLVREPCQHRVTRSTLALLRAICAAVLISADFLTMHSGHRGPESWYAAA